MRHGDPAAELARLAEETDAAELHLSADVGPFARRRQRQVKAGPGKPGRRGVRPPRAVRRRRAGAHPDRSGRPLHGVHPLLQEVAQPAPADRAGRPSLASADRPQGARRRTADACTRSGSSSSWRIRCPGERRPAARGCERFLAGPVDDYQDGRNVLTGESVSRLSPYLHFGCLSPREIEERLGRGGGAEAYRRQICWRDFYAHVLGHYPANATSEFQERYRGMTWSHAEQRFEAWCEGRTGYPTVDAAMRQLRREGWIHNRGRLVVGSFLTKDLGIDWRWGERWFMRWLLDGDQASNNGNWQWIASVGVDPAPAFQRIFNPARQQQRFDPQGRVRAALRSRARQGSGRVPGRAVDDARRAPARRAAASSAATTRSRSSTTPRPGGRRWTATAWSLRSPLDLKETFNC